jgi:hypothetical protein
MARHAGTFASTVIADTCHVIDDGHINFVSRLSRRVRATRVPRHGRDAVRAPMRVIAAPRYFPATLEISASRAAADVLKIDLSRAPGDVPMLTTRCSCLARISPPC